MLHSPLNLNHPHQQLLGHISQETAYHLPTALTDKFKRVNIAIWIETRPASTQYRRIHQRPTYTISPVLPSPTEPTPAPIPKTIPHTMSEIVLLFLNTDPSDPYYGDPFFKSLDLQNLQTPPSNPASFYTFCISPLHIFNNHQRELLRAAAIRLGCPPPQSLQIPFTNPHPTNQDQQQRLDFENTHIPSHNLAPLGASQQFPKPPKPTNPTTAPRPRGRPPKGGHVPVPDKLFAAYTARRLGAGLHNLPNGHNHKHALSGGWPNPQSLLAYERAFLEEGAKQNNVPVLPITPDRQARHNADLLIYQNLPQTLDPTAIQQSLATISTYINHPSTAAHEDPNTPAQYRIPKDHPAFISNHLTDRTIAQLVEAIDRVVNDTQT